MAAADAQMMCKSAKLPLRATPLKGGKGTFSDKAWLLARQSAIEAVARRRVASKQQQRQHYILSCKICDFTHHVPDSFADNQMKFSVDRETAKLTGVYGTFTVSLEVGEFVEVKSTPSSGQVLRGEIAANMKVLHSNMLWHCDPLSY